MTTSSSRAEGDLVIQLTPGSVSWWFWYRNDRAIVSKSFGTRAQCVEMTVASIQEHKPTRVFVQVDGIQHKISSKMVQGILEGKVTPADITVG